MTRSRSIIIAALVMLLLGSIALVIYQRNGEHAGPAQVIGGVVQDDSGRRVLYWYDPMAPQQKFTKPGKSPFMDMMLKPKYADEESAAGLSVSPAMAQSLGVRTGRAEITALGSETTAVARVEVDEHRIYAVQTRAPGFVENLYVRAVGDRVRRGQKIADVYAPELLAAQQELLALRRLQNVPDLDALRAGARERLRLLGMSEAEIRNIEAAGAPQRTFGVYASAGGVVQELGVREGAQVMPGQTLLQVADLSTVWLIAAVPERDVARIASAQHAEARFDALPDARHSGRVDYIYPDLDPATRTARVRIALPNPRGRLQPGMYANVTLQGAQREVLSVPSEAVIATGTRNVIITRSNGAYIPVEVQIGAEGEDRTEILGGIAPGTEVVLSGQFLIDSEASLRGVLARLASAEKRAETSAVVSASGIVRAIAGERITLSHGPIAELGWPAMTMAFTLRDPKMAQGIAPGTRVTVDIAREPENGDYLIERIQIKGAR